MKVTLLIILLSASYSYGFSDVESIIQNKCISNGQSKDHFKLAVNVVRDCIENSLKSSEPPHPVQKHQKFCRYLREENFYGCIKNFTTSLMPCLDKSETYLEHFILHAIHSGYNEICGPEGLSIMKYFDDKLNRTDECIAYAVQWYMFSGICISDLTLFKNLDKGIINLNKKNICLDLDSLRSCSTNLTESICNARGGNEDFSRVTDILFQPFLEQCNDFIERNSVLIK